MRISSVDALEDGTIVATVVNEDNVIVGYNVYSPESSPIPAIDEEL